MEPAEFYTGIVARVYGLLKGTSFPAERYAQFIAAHGEPALELGCGDDGPFFELAERFDIDGVDSSADMVRAGRDRLAAAGIRAGLFRQRMEALDLPRSYASVYLAGPTFNLLPDDATALAALHGIRRHLCADGAALVPLWIPQPTPSAEFGITREAHTDGALARYTVVGEDYDADSRTRTTHTRYELSVPTGTETVDRDWVIHWFTPEVFREFAGTAGLDAAFDHAPDPGGEFAATLTPAPG